MRNANVRNDLKVQHLGRDKQVNDLLFVSSRLTVALNGWQQVIMDLINYLSAEEWQTANAGNLDGTQIIDQLLIIIIWLRLVADITRALIG